MAGALAGLLVLGMTVAVTYGALMRYFRKPAVGVDELTGYALVGVTFLCLADALRHGSHITADVLVSRLGARSRQAVYGATLLLSIGYVLALVWSARWLAWDSLKLDSLSVTLRVPVFIPQLVILVGLAVFELQLLSELWAAVGLTRKRTDGA